ncbi:hypothetical protein RND71_042329 [Anisodus tanguticus]|uniref:Uncharacterized protein n=1 Tax=Anisodus tanguticus TaxID=243964 RepID=A0AAE1QT97_9SOLA|nr:hypothetical protein RND71_042329 [Anisodus tanguticus]
MEIEVEDAKASENYRVGVVDKNKILNFTEQLESTIIFTVTVNYTSELIVPSLMDYMEHMCPDFDDGTLLENNIVEANEKSTNDYEMLDKILLMYGINVTNLQWDDSIEDELPDLENDELSKKHCRPYEQVFKIDPDVEKPENLDKELPIGIKSEYEENSENEERQVFDDFSNRNKVEFPTSIPTLVDGILTEAQNELNCENFILTGLVNMDNDLLDTWQVTLLLMNDYCKNCVVEDFIPDAVRFWLHNPNPRDELKKQSIMNDANRVVWIESYFGLHIHDFLATGQRIKEVPEKITVRWNEIVGYALYACSGSNMLQTVSSIQNVIKKGMMYLVDFAASLELRLDVEANNYRYMASSELIKSRKSSDPKLDYSNIIVELRTLDCLVKERTHGAPNGYHFIPVYDKGSFLIKVNGPEGWSWDPEQVPVVIDHTGCTGNEDINFIIVGNDGGESCSQKDRGPSNVNVELLSHTCDIVSSALSTPRGTYSFTNTIPKKYKLRASCHDLNVQVRGSAEIELGFENKIVDDFFFIPGYDIRGYMVAQGNAILGGCVVDGDGNGIKGVEILVDGQKISITDKEGNYKLTSKRYTIEAKKATPKVKHDAWPVTVDDLKHKCVNGKQKLGRQSKLDFLDVKNVISEEMKKIEGRIMRRFDRTEHIQMQHLIYNSTVNGCSINLLNTYCAQNEFTPKIHGGPTEFPYIVFKNPNNCLIPQFVSVSPQHSPPPSVPPLVAPPPIVPPIGPQVSTHSSNNFANIFNLGPQFSNLQDIRGNEIVFGGSRPKRTRLGKDDDFDPTGSDSDDNRRLLRVAAAT